MPRPLWQATRDLHHDAEAHPLARAMIDATAGLGRLAARPLDHPAGP